MIISYVFSDWLADMRNYWEFSISTLPWRLLTVAFVFFVLSAVAALFLCIWRSFTFDIATKEDIINDRRHCPTSWFYGEEYEKVNMAKTDICKYMLYANLSFHTFWNAVIMGYYRLCGVSLNRMYFRVNRFSDRHWDIFASLKRLFTIYSLAFIWGYPLFLGITLLRMAFCKKPLC